MRWIGSFSVWLMWVGLCSGEVSTNVPLYHWSYDAIEKLINYRLIDTSMMSTRPVSRMQMAHLIDEALVRFERYEPNNEIVGGILDRLKIEFEEELILIGVLDGDAAESFFKPIEDPYVKYLYADRPADIENVRGDTFGGGSNSRVGFAARGKLYDTAAFFVRPEYAASWDPSEGNVDLVEGYGKVSLLNVEVQVGKDSMWWGPGRHGSLLMSNNARPLPMVKITNPEPIQLPWLFRYLGLIRGTWFLAQLENSRVVPKTKLTGVRFNAKPVPYVEMGISRVMMFGGEGRPGVGLGDYFEMFFADDDHAESNQLAGVDLAWTWWIGDFLPIRTVRGYADVAGEDEASGLPSDWGYLVGMELSDILRTGRTDLRIEFAENRVPGEPNVFYNHSIYRSGYTYKGRVMGHHMGTDSMDLFVQLRHYLAADVVLCAAFDSQRHALSAAEQTRLDQLSLEVTFFDPGRWQVQTGYRYEDGKNSTAIDNHIVYIDLVLEF